MPEAMRVLIVDDDADMARLLRGLVSSQGYGVVEHVVTGGEALAVADRFDVILLDHQLPDVSGVEVVEEMRARPEPPSVIIVTGHGTESLAAAALRRGADDYLVKDAALPHLLPEVLERVRRQRALRSALRTAQEELVRAERLAAIGEMTVTLHHEINNPLMAASAEVDLLLARATTLKEDQVAGLEAVREALARIAEIVRRIGTLREARTSSYPGDRRMIDISELGTPDGAAHIVGTAVMYVPDDDLARVTGLLLGRAGFRVRRSRSVDELAQGAAEAGVRIVLFSATRESPTAGLELQRKRSWWAIGLAADEEVARRAEGCDLLVRVPFDPAILLGDFQRLAG